MALKATLTVKVHSESQEFINLKFFNSTAKSINTRFDGHQIPSAPAVHGRKLSSIDFTLEDIHFSPRGMPKLLAFLSVLVGPGY